MLCVNKVFINYKGVNLKLKTMRKYGLCSFKKLSQKKKKSKSKEIEMIKNADVSRIRINLTFGRCLL